MGLLDAIESVANRNGQSTTTNAQVASGMMQTLDEHAGGLAGVLNSFRNNGMDQHVQNWATGQQQTATPDQIQQGLGSEFIDKVANRAGVSPEVAKVAMATLLPVVIAHFTRGGQEAPPQSGFGGMASQILGRFL